ncbi:MAG TPA: hypothetical protein VFH89_14435 [Sphingomicrobium sp.]|nr:hypothetical protein [Sphingomicrobium sp.]
MTDALIGLAFGVGYALINMGRRSYPLSITEIFFGGVFGIPDNADAAPDALPIQEQAE